MKKLLKFICVFMSITLLLCSCTKPDNNHLDKFKYYLSNNQFNECQQLIATLNDEEKHSLNNDICNLIANKFNELAKIERIDFNNPYDLSSYDNEFTEICYKLWGILKTLTVDEKSENYQTFVYIRYFAESNEFIKNRELYRILNKVHQNGYLDTVNTALFEYSKSKSTKLFESAYNSVKSFSFNDFDNQQNTVIEYKSAHNELISGFETALKAIKDNKSYDLAKAVNALHSTLTKIMSFIDTLKSVHSLQNSLFIELSKPGNLYSTFKVSIKPENRVYTPGINFKLSSIFGNLEFIDDSDLTNLPNRENDLTLDEALSVVINSINKTKAYMGEISIDITEQRDVLMTSFITDTTVTSSLELIKNEFNAEIEKTNGTSSANFVFKGGICEEKTLLTFIPPKIGNAQLVANAVESYTAVRGDAGYIITLTLKADTTNNDNPYSNVGSIVNGFALDNYAGVNKFNSTYSPTAIMLVINNSGYLVKFQYTVIGTSSCDFISDDGKDEATAVFSFDDRFMYKFKY